LFALKLNDAKNSRYGRGTSGLPRWTFARIISGSTSATDTGSYVNGSGTVGRIAANAAGKHTMGHQVRLKLAHPETSKNMWEALNIISERE
jgi:hypothetical protein